MVKKIGGLLAKLHGERRVVADIIALLVFAYLMFSILEDVYKTIR